MTHSAETALDSSEDRLGYIQNPDIRRMTLELAGLRPDWVRQDADYHRSVEILKYFDGAILPDGDNERIFHFLRLQWADASGVAASMGLMKLEFQRHASLSQQLAGVCLIRSNMAQARFALDRAAAPA